MIAIEVELIVTKDGRFDGEAPSDVPPGKHKAVLTVEEQPDTTGERPTFSLPVHDVGPWPADLSLRREDMYDEWGR